MLDPCLGKQIVECCLYVYLTLEISPEISSDRIVKLNFFQNESAFNSTKINRTLASLRNRGFNVDAMLECFNVFINNS